MRPRVLMGHFLIRLGRFIQDLAIMIMRPHDLMEFSRQSYTKPRSVNAWGQKDLVDSGLNPDEKRLLNDLSLKEGRILLLGVGGGREAIALARKNYEVTGVDFIPGMVDKAKENAAICGLKIEGLVQEISKLDVPANSYDIVWLSAGSYSSVPTKKRRQEMLKRIGRALKPEGYFVYPFRWALRFEFSPKVQTLRKLFAVFTLGNMEYEKGDMLYNNNEFVHAFSTVEEIRLEFEEGGFEVVHIHKR
jgi:SAM-dependent methyltransferase